MAAPAAFIIVASLRWAFIIVASLRCATGLRQEGNICYDAYPPFRLRLRSPLRWANVSSRLRRLEHRLTGRGSERARAGIPGLTAAPPPALCRPRGGLGSKCRAGNL